jgi:hypothetical protein
MSPKNRNGGGILLKQNVMVILLFLPTPHNYIMAHPSYYEMYGKTKITVE